MAEGFTYRRANTILKDNITENTFVCLSTTTPGKDGSNFTEPNASTGYTRAKFGIVNMTVDAQIANDAIIFIFEALQDVGSVTHIGLADSREWGSEVFLVGRLTSPLTVGAGYVPLIRARKLVIALDREEIGSYA